MTIKRLLMYLSIMLLVGCSGNEDDGDDNVITAPELETEVYPIHDPILGAWRLSTDLEFGKYQPEYEIGEDDPNTTLTRFFQYEQVSEIVTRRLEDDDDLQDIPSPPEAEWKIVSDTAIIIFEEHNVWKIRRVIRHQVIHDDREIGVIIYDLTQIGKWKHNDDLSITLIFAAGTGERNRVVNWTVTDDGSTLYLEDERGGDEKYFRHHQ